MIKNFVHKMLYSAVICLLGIVGHVSASSCDYQKCNLGEKDHLNVHLVPHTHDDVGWLKTVDQYYYGANNSIAIAGVQYILDTVIPHLVSDPSKRFIYVEIAFFSRWWKQQSQAMKSLVKMLVKEAYSNVQKAAVQYILDTSINALLLNPKRKFIYVEIAYFKRWWDEQNDMLRQQVVTLVNEGRLEFILGGWCMNDEAATHYNAIIDQMSLGLRFLNETFGECARPRVAWQIDPFGHSREQASLFAQMGFDGLFFGRLDYQDKTLREKQNRMEEIWRGSDSLMRPTADLFTGVNENGYGPPSGFCFDELCGDSPIMDDPDLEEYNVDEKVNFFLDAARHQAKHFKTNHIMMTMGSDFQYSNAQTWFKNLDKLIKYVNAANKSVSVFYSTPSCYLYALNQASEKWSIKTDDFFPYADSPHAFWTGYFTSRPGLKAYVRESNNFLQVCNHLEAFHDMNKESKLLNTTKHLREAMGVAQHHDAVSGTSKQHVANDYAKRLYKGRQSCKCLLSEAITGKINTLNYCDYLNITLCNYTQHMNQFVVVVYNPLARPVSKYLRLPISTTRGTLFNVAYINGSDLSFQIVPVNDGTMSTRRNRGNADSELVFLAHLPALGYSEIVVTKTASSKKFHAIPSYKKIKNEDAIISNEYYKVLFDGTSGLMKAIVNTESSIEMPVSQNLYWYNASMGNNVSNQQSGAYIFRPNSTHLFPCANGQIETHVVQSENSLVHEVYQKFSNWAWQVVRLYKGKKFVEVEWTIGPIPFKDIMGKEVISRYSTSLKTAGLFYTDSNGREILERKRNFRPTWTLNQSEPIAGNYFPVNSRIFIKDTNFQFTILNDRSQGGASIEDGSVELMLHRRLFGEDSKGVGEALNETGQFGDGLIVRGKQWLILDTVEKSARQHRLLAEQVYMDALVAFTNTTSIYNEFKTGSLLNSALPDNVHLLTLATTDSGIMIRLEHQFAVEEDAEMSKPVTVSLKTLFKNFQPVSVEELELGGNVLKSQVTRLNWEEKVHKRDVDAVLHFERPYKPNNGFSSVSNNQFDVVLQPMQIRTFLLH